jgi:hypothetical protein
LPPPFAQTQTFGRKRSEGIRMRSIAKDAPETLLT